MSQIYKTTFTEIQGRPGIYLVCPGSNSVWAGFISVKQARTCLLVLDGWKITVQR